MPEVEVPFLEDLLEKAKRVHIPELAKANTNKNVMWSAKMYVGPGCTEVLTGQMSEFLRIIYDITPGKDKTAKTNPTDFRNCEVIVNKANTKFIELCNILDEIGLAHFIKYKDHYWEGEELTDRQVTKKYRRLIMPTKDGTSDTFRMKLMPMERLDYKTKAKVPNKYGTKMFFIDENDNEAEEPTSIDEIHTKTDTRDFVQNICRFTSIYRSDAWAGISVHVPMGWHKREEVVTYTRKKRRAPTSTANDDADADTAAASKRAATEGTNPSDTNGGTAGNSNNNNGGDSDVDDGDVADNVYDDEDNEDDYD